jgi:hypothetical protein
MVTAEPADGRAVRRVIRPTLAARSAQRNQEETEPMQNNQEQIKALMAAVGVVGVLFVAVIAIAIGCLICWYLSSCLKRVPPQFRRQEPAMAWLLLIPCFNLVWNFFVYPKIGESYQAYFDSIGRTDLGDCGRSLGLSYCILSVAGLPLGMIPVIGGVVSCFLGLATLVVWILFLVKAGNLKSQIPLDAGGA